jgi:hypothetical protein
MTDKLAPVFLDNKPVDLQDPMPKLSAILNASGKTSATDVKWLQFQPNSQGKSVRPEEVLDRTSTPNVPIYLTSGRAAASAPAGLTAKIPPIAAPVPMKAGSDAEKDEPTESPDEAEPADENEQ